MEFKCGLLKLPGGEGGIRTHGTIASTRTFQARSFGHSDTSPKLGLFIILLFGHSPKESFGLTPLRKGCKSIKIFISIILFFKWL